MCFNCCMFCLAVCDEENTTSDQFGSYMWPLTIAGDTRLEQCTFRAGYNASRTCSQEGSWIAVNFADCRMSKCLSLVFQQNDNCFHSSYSIEKSDTVCTVLFISYWNLC